jgi:minor curlin subunit
MNHAQRIASKTLLPLLPLLFAALSSPALQAAGPQTMIDLAPSELVSNQAHVIAPARSDYSDSADNLALVTQVGDSLTAHITQTGNALEAFILQSGYAHDATIVQQGLIVQFGTDNQARIEQYGAYNDALIDRPAPAIAVALRRMARV